MLRSRDFPNLAFAMIDTWIRTADWFRRNEGIAWIGLAVGLAGLLGGQWTGGHYISFGSGIVFGAFGLGLLWTAFSRSELVCVECRIELELTGRRGQRAKRTLTQRFRVLKPTTTFDYALRSAGGERLGNPIVNYRTVKDGTPTIWHRLYDGQHVHTATAPGDKLQTVRISLPSRAERGDVLEFQDTSEIQAGFERDEEYVGKNILHPTKDLLMLLKFSGCQPINGWGQFFVGNIPKKGFAVPITPSGTFFAAEVKPGRKLRPTEAFRVSWRWQDDLDKTGTSSGEVK